LVTAQVAIERRFRASGRCLGDFPQYSLHPRACGAEVAQHAAGVPL